MWSDGGHWLGSGSRPRCFLVMTTTAGHELSRTWPTEDSVIATREKFNQFGNRMGYAVGAALTIVLAMFGAPLWLDLAAGFGAGLATDNIPSIIPLIRSGDRLVIQFDITVSLSAHPRRRDEFTYSSEWTLTSRSGQVKHQSQDEGRVPTDYWSHEQFESLYQAVDRQRRASRSVEDRTK